MLQQFINKHCAYLINLFQVLLTTYFLDKTMYYQAYIHNS